MDENGVAIVGIACRFPGADNIDEYWKLMENGECHVKKIPDDRWIVDEIDVKEDDSWKPCARHAGLINEWDKWDNKFFGISDTEAAWMNPQQCMAIEVTHSALENAGYTKEKMKGTKTGVYIGIMNDDLSSGLIYARNEFNNFLVTGIAGGITANRISYYYDLRGPSIMIDTACSSALVATHLGCQAIRSGECDMAICGGANSILTPMKFIALSKAKMISPTGLSHTFSDKADGYVRGEGCGILILKNLKKARSDGDKIWGILGTGCNQDGQSNVPITAPSSEQQKALLTEVYQKYKVKPGSIQYIEAHGTGTPVGDPIEMKALSTFFGPHLKSGISVPVGSVKTNIGHLESAAGAAGLIKVLLMMSHGKIIPSLHYEKHNANPKIDFDKIPLVVATSVSDWKADAEDKRIACVNSFGFGGTNCHAVLVQEHEKHDIKTNTKDNFIVCVTGTSIPAVHKTCLHMKHKLQDSNYDIKDLSYTSLMRRDHYRYRLAFVATTIEEAIKEIDKRMEKNDPLEATDTQEKNLVFLFCGVGTVWNGTCRDMYKTNSVFRNKFDQIDKEMKKCNHTISLAQTIENSNESLIHDSFKGPLIIFACQVSLFHMWTTLGVLPDKIIGQSVGEVAAAHVAGCFSLQDAVKIIYNRSLLTSQTMKGLMMVIGKCNIKEIEKFCEEIENVICIAVYSSKEACVVSGSENGVLQLKQKLQTEKPHLLMKVLDVSCAYHSSYMDSVSEQMTTKIENLQGGAPKTYLISTVTGKRVTDSIMGTADYWRKNLRDPVLLREAVSNALQNDRKNIILELGPKPVIRAHLKNITHLNAVSIASLNQPNERRTAVTAIAELFQRGYFIDFKPFFFSGSEVLTDIPSYQFNRSGVLLKSDAVRSCLKSQAESNDGHPFVFRKSSSSDFKIDLFPLTTPFVFEHIVHGRNIAPGALYAEICLVIARSVLNVALCQVKISLAFLKPLRVGDQSVSLHAKFNERESTIDIKRLDDLICRGKIKKIPEKTSHKVNIEEFKMKCTTCVNPDQFYETLKSLGLQYGRSLTLVGNCWRSRYEYIAEINFCEEIHGRLDDLYLHPTILDGALQTMALTFQTKSGTNVISSQEDNRRIPVKLKSVIVHKKPQKEMFVVGQLLKANDVSSNMNLLIVDKDGNVVVEIEGYEVQNIGHGAKMHSLNDKLYKLDWKQIEFEDNLPFENQRSLVITFTTEGSELFKKYFPSSVKIVCVPYLSKKSIVDIFNDVLQIIQSVCGPLSRVSEILYYPGLHLGAAHEDGNEIFAMVKTSCLVLTYLIQHLLKENIDIPLYLITKQCQSYLSGKGADCQVNVIGSELWGMGRCLARERTFDQVRLIDFYDDTDVNLIKCIVFSADKEKWQKIPEFNLQKGCIYINQIVRGQSERPSLRHAVYNSGDTVELRSKVQKRLDGPFFVPVSSDDSKSEQSNCVKIQVSTSYTSDIWVPAFSTDLSGTDPWGIFGKDGYQIFPTEIEGCVVPRNAVHKSSPTCFGSSKITPAANLIERKEIVTCFQTKCTNYVTIPESCLIEKVLIPWYKPCSLIEIIMIFELLEKSANYSPIAIIYDEHLPIDIAVLNSIAERLKKRIAFVETIGNISNQICNVKLQFAILSKDKCRVLGALRHISQGSISILSFSSFVTKTLERNIRRSYPNCTLTLVNVEEILTHEKLSISMKKIRSWLKSRITLKPVSRENSNYSKHISGISYNAKKDDKNLLLAIDIPVTTTENQLFSQQAIYVVIGGLTGLGWKIVVEIAEKGGGGIAILARRIPNEEQRHNMNFLKSHYNCIIDHIQADVSEKESLVKAFDYIKRSYPNHRIRGIFHGAAVVEDSIISKMTDDKFDKVLRPKVLGTWNLHTICKDLNLDYFVLHSSITSVFGNSGQTNYGAGNSFKDAMAFYRRSIGMSGQTINWGPLKLGLLKTFEHVEKHLNKQGYISLSESEIIDCFEHSLLTNDVQVLCAMFDWKTVIRQSPDVVHLSSKIWPILEEYNLVDLFTTSSKNAITSVDLEEIMNMTLDMQKLKIEEIVILIAAEVCAVETSALNSNTKLQVIGMDSMKGMAFINTVYEYVSCKIPVLSVIEETTTIEIVANLILDQLRAGSKKIGYVPIEEMHEFKREIEKIKTPLTPIESMYFDEKRNENKRTFSFIEATLSIDEHSHDDLMKLIHMWTEHIIKTNPVLSSVYFVENGIPYRISDLSALSEIEENIKKLFPEVSLTNLIDIVENTGLSSPNINFRFLSNNTCNNEEIIFEKVSGPKSQLLTVQIGKCNDRAFKIVLRFDKMFFDNNSVILLMYDLVVTMKKRATAELPFTLLGSDANTTLSFLNDSEQKRLFWEKRLSSEIQPIYVSRTLPQSSTNGDLIIRRTAFKDSAKIAKWTSDQSIPIRDLLLSVYQILLNFISENCGISILTNFSLHPVNNDLHGPELILPIITQLHEDEIAVGKFIEGVSEEIKLVAQNCLSYDKLLSDPSFDHIFSNALFVDNYDFEALPSDDLFKQQVRFCSVDSRYKTVVRILVDQRDNKIYVDFQCPTNVAGDQVVCDLLTGLLELTDTIVDNDKLSVKQLRRGFKKQMEKKGTSGNDSNKIFDMPPTQDGAEFHTYNVIKETSQGLDHSVKLILTATNGTNGGISWYTRNHKNRKIVDTRLISKLKLTSANGMRIISVETAKRPYIFKSRDFQQMDLIWERLESMARPTMSVRL